MGKYTNAWFYQKTDPNHHDCANDDTCGQSITKVAAINGKFVFSDNNEKLIAEVPILPKYSSDKYGHQLYKEAESKQFNYFSTNIHDVLSNSFTVKCGYINYTIKYDNLSQQERSQIETDIKTAYEAFKEKFCFKDSSISKNITVYIFNNRSNYTKYNNLLGIDEDGGPGYITRGVTDYQNILTYKQSAMDFVLAHELGHIFQLRFSPTEKVRDLHYSDTEFIANVIGREVEEKNYKAICKQMGVDEYEDHGWMFKFKYKDTTGSIYRKDLSEEEKLQIIQHVKNSGLDEYEDRGSMFQFKYKGTLYKYHKNLSEEEKIKAIQNVKNIHELVDEYKDHGSMFSFKYKGTTCSIYRKDLSEEEKLKIIQRVKNSGLDEYEDRGWMFSFKYEGTLYKYHKNLSEEEKIKAIQNVKNIRELVDEYEDHGSMFSFKYKGTTCSIYREDLSEEEKFQVIQNARKLCELVVEYTDFGWMFQFKYKDTTGSIYRKDLSEEEKFQIIQRIKNSGLDEYEDRGSMFSFKYKGTTYSIYRKDLSEEEKFQFIKDIKNSHESLVSECDGLGNENTTLLIYVDENKEISRMYFQNSGKNIFKQLDKTLISRSKSEEEANENRTNPEPEEEQKGDEYTEFTGVLQFKYKGTNYDIQHKGYLSAEEEKLQFIKDIKNSHESLISECDGLNEGPLSQNATVVIFVDENKEISQMYFHNPDKNMSEWLDKTLISRSKPEEDVDDTNPKPGKEPEPESGKEPKEDISRSKPEQDVDEADYTEGKEPKEDTQQPSNFLSNIFSTMKSIIDSISSFFSWLFGSKEKEQSDDNLSLLNLSEEQSDDNLSLLKPDVNHDADENYVGNYSLCNHDYHQHDDLI